MTEMQWERSTQLSPMLNFLLNRISNRKFQLFAIACCHQQWDLFNPQPARQTVNCAESYADRTGLESELRDLAAESLRVTDDYSRPVVERSSCRAAHFTAMCSFENSCYCAASAARWVLHSIAAYRGLPEHDWESVRILEEYQQIRLIYDIVGNPNRSVFVDTEYITSTVLALARGIYESRDFSAMPILADALQDAGCEDAAILDHCRDPIGVHTRGCWVVDLVLDKK